MPLKLISINESEVLCFSPQTSELLIFNHNLEQVARLGQSESENEGFYFKNVIVIDANRHFILCYQTKSCEQEESNVQKQTIQILNRTSGMVVGKILIESEYFSLLLKLDLHGNIFYKPHLPQNLLRCYEAPSGRLVDEFINPRFVDMSSMEMTKICQMACFNRRANRMDII